MGTKEEFEKRARYVPGARFRINSPHSVMHGRTGILLESEPNKTPIYERDDNGYRIVGHKILPNAVTNWWNLQFDNGTQFCGYWWEALEIQW